ncbi:MAG TPA: HAD hydrolase-like protein [Verrucomicrobiae bacterium]|nr:HAD hydrolase-like protein [Verrucomicrobiae bacterium]
MKLFVWDFHGVLEKDNDKAVLEISNEVLRQAGHAERFSEEDNRAFYGLKWFQYFERLLPDLTNEQHMALQAACFVFAEENLHILAKHIKPNDHAVAVLESIHGAAHDQIILSNTRPHDLLWFVDTVGIQHLFPKDKVVGVNAHQKHGTKKDALAQYLKGKSLDGIVIIGDSQTDIDLHQVAGGTTYHYVHPHIATPSPVTADHSIRDLRQVLQEL